MDIFTWLKIKKYHYKLFLKPLAPLNQIKVIARKIKAVSLPNGLPQTLEIGLTYQCQLKCIHCGVHGQSDFSRLELSPSEIKQVIAQAYNLGVYLIVFSGGEPLLKENITEFVSYASNRGIITALSTNGQLLTQSTIHQLKKGKIGFVNISIDSAQPMVHDQKRGATGCFRKAEEGIRRCVDEGISTIVSTYATKENIDNGDLESIISLARRLGAQGVRILPSVSAGKWLGCSQMVLTAQEKQCLRSLLDPCYVYMEGVCNRFTECNAILKKLFYLSPYGDVQPCSFVPISFGNIRERPLAEILKEMNADGFYNGVDKEDCIMNNRLFQKRYTDVLKSDDKKLPVRIEELT